MPTPRLAGLVAGATLLLIACASKPTTDELAQAILAATNADPDVQVTADQATCIADHLLASRLSDTTLSGLAQDFGNPEVLETEIDDIEPLVAEAAVACQ